MAASWPLQLSDSVNAPLTVVTIPVSGRSPVFVSVIVCAGEDCPVSTPPKFSEAADKLSIAGAQPNPLRATVCVFDPSVNVSVPVAGPRCVGAKASSSWQSAPAASELLHWLVEILNGGVMVMLEIETGAVLLLPASTCSVPEVVPTGTGGNVETWPGAESKLMVVGVSVINPAAVPVPLNSTYGSWPP